MVFNPVFMTVFSPIRGYFQVYQLFLFADSSPWQIFIIMAVVIVEFLSGPSSCWSNFLLKIRSTPINWL
jgi:hypothetical protein